MSIQTSDIHTYTRTTFLEAIRLPVSYLLSSRDKDIIRVLAEAQCKHLSRTGHGSRTTTQGFTLLQVPDDHATAIKMHSNTMKHMVLQWTLPFTSCTVSYIACEKNTIETSKIALYLEVSLIQWLRSTEMYHLEVSYIYRFINRFYCIPLNSLHLQNKTGLI